MSQNKNGGLKQNREIKENTTTHITGTDVVQFCFQTILYIYCIKIYLL